jgi:hypothetical protein
MAHFSDCSVLDIGTAKWNQKLAGYSEFSSANFQPQSFLLPAAENVSETF